jgi:hypothetical protein
MSTETPHPLEAEDLPEVGLRYDDRGRGGISAATAAGAWKAGADLLVAGSAILGAEGKQAAVAELRRCLEFPARPVPTRGSLESQR